MKKHSILQRVSFAALPMVALLLGSVAHQAQAQSSPVGDWDFYFTGAQKGVAQITFDPDFTVNGIQIHMPGKTPKTLDSSNPRGGNFDPENPRGGGGAAEQDEIVYNYGGALISGNWGYDLKGKLVGAMTLTTTSATNGISFRGTAATGRRMTLRVLRDGAGSVFHGVPRVALPDISGDYYLSGEKSKGFFSEILAIAPSGAPNDYDMTRIGPGYAGDGFVLLTSNNRLGFYGEHFTPGTSNLVITSMSGKFSTSKAKGKLTGYDGTNYFKVTIGSAVVPD